MQTEQESSGGCLDRMSIIALGPYQITDRDSDIKEFLEDAVTHKVLQAGFRILSRGDSLGRGAPSTRRSRAA